MEQSKNTVAWQLFDELTPEVGLQYLMEMNFSKIVKSDYYNASSLGGLTYGCSPLEMASAYATIENDGKYRDPTCIVKILDADGNTIVDDDVDEKYIYDSTAANQMVDILKGVLTRGTGVGLGLDNGMEAAGKTGTTNDKKDGWFCGFTPYYTTAVWIGCDSPTTISDLYGSTYPGRTWKTFMNEIHAELEPKVFSFEESDESQKATSKPSYSYKNNNSSSDDSDDEEATEKPKKTKKPKATKTPEETDDASDEGDTSTQPPVDDSNQTTPDDGSDLDDINNSSNDDTTFSQDNTTYQSEDGTVQP